MKRRWIAIYGASLLVGVLARDLAPDRWRLSVFHALLLGTALYFGALHRYVALRVAGTEPRLRPSRGGMWTGLVVRASFFLAIAALQALACFEWARQADLRAGFVIAATWLVALAVIDTS
jgi:hypothetical protein